MCVVALRCRHINGLGHPEPPAGITGNDLQNRRPTHENPRQSSAPILLKPPTPSHLLNKMVHRVTVKVNNSTPFTLQPHGQYAFWGETNSGPQRVR